jgi:acyl-CoA reductase-like NAD-dependent aldehyde dehydrogenase
LPAHQRAEILDRAAALLRERNEEFGQSISAESAKPITLARIEAARAVDTLTFSAIEARTLVGEMINLDATAAGVGKLGYVKRVPIGVVGAISPFKPASATPLTALRIARLFHEAGLPAGWLNVVTCPGSVADRLTTHDDVSMITFTGSPEVGWGIRSRAARKRVSLELGNNAPVVVEPDADLELAATKIVAGGFGFSGQTCISVQRVYAHSSIHDELLELVAAKVAALVVGDPADPATVISSLIARKESERVKSWIDEAVADGARLVTGGAFDDTEVLRPTLLANVTADMKVCADEVFGPVVGFAAYEDYETALELANNSRYGLQAAVFTRDLAKALRAADVLDFGGVLVNEMPTWRADQQPYGGIRDSGNTREGPAFTVQEMTERRTIIITP